MESMVMKSTKEIKEKNNNEEILTQSFKEKSDECNKSNSEMN
jgi:hypothetical protein